jgi:tyrosine-protein kinase Etk/Wzc
MLNSRQESEAPRSTAGAEVEAPNPVRRRAPGARTTHASHEPTVADLAWTLAERRWTVVAVAGAVLAFAAAYLLVASPTYESSVLIQVEGRARPVAGFQDLAPLFGGETPAEGEMRIMKSRAVLDAVIEQLGLDVEARARTLPIIGGAFVRRYQGTAPAPARFGLSRFAWGGERIGVKQLTVSDALLGEPLVVTVLEGGRYQTAASDGTVLVEGEVGKPATGTDGDRSVEMLLTELTARPGTEVTLRKLRRIDVIEQLQESLRISEQGRRTGLVEVTLVGQDPARIAVILDAVSANYLRQSVERTSAEAAKTLQILEAQLPVLKSTLDKAEIALNRFRQKNGTVNLSLEAEAMLARIGEIDRSIAENEVRSAELHRFTVQHPDISTLAEKTDRLRSQRAAMEARMRALPDMELESTRLSRQVRVAAELYTLVLNRTEELRIVKSGWIGNARVLEQAVEPYRPVSPKRGIVLTLAMLLGVAGGIAAALVRNALDEGVRDPDEIEARTGLPVFATIPRSRAQRRLARRGRRGRLDALSVVEPGDPAVEDLRGLRTGVQFALLRATNNIVAVGSPAPRAGKSFVSVNLAHLLATSDGRVLIVDGDLRRGILHRYFGLEAKPGLSDVLSGQAALESAVHGTDSPNLDLLPGGQRVTNPAELLAGAPFQQLLAELGRRYKIVIIDTPPILSVTDSALVGRHAGVNLLVLRAGEHSSHEIALAVKRLVQNGVTVRGAILNEVRPSHGRYGRSGRYRRYDTRSA